MWEAMLLSRTYSIFGEHGKLESFESARYWCYGTLLLQRTFLWIDDRSHAPTMPRKDADKRYEATKFVKAHLALPLSHSIWRGKQKSSRHNNQSPRWCDATQHDNKNQFEEKKASCHARIYLCIEWPFAIFPFTIISAFWMRLSMELWRPSWLSFWPTARHLRMYSVLVFGRY
jgi:hypothetical protein